MLLVTLYDDNSFRTVDMFDDCMESLISFAIWRGTGRPLSFFGDFNCIYCTRISLDESLVKDSSSIVGWSFVCSTLNEIFLDLLELSKVAPLEL